MAARLGAHRPDMGLEAVLGCQPPPVIGHGQRQEMILDIGVLDIGRGSDEAAALEMIGGAEPFLGEQPARPDRPLGEGRHGREQGDRFAASHLEVEFQMVLKVLADARPIGHDIDPEIAQFAGWSNAGEFQELGRIDRASRENHLAPRHRTPFRGSHAVRNARSDAPVEKHALDQRVGFDLQVRPAQRGLQIGVGGGPAPPSWTVMSIRPKPSCVAPLMS